MKTKLLILISILIAIQSCQNNDFKSEGNWIGVYSLLDRSSQIHELEKAYVDDTIRSKKILSFEEDSMILVSFNETLYYGFNQNKFKFKLEEDSIKFNYEEKETGIEYSYENQFLVIDFYGDERIKHIDYFIQIDDYGMSHKEKEISSFLTNNPIVIGQRKDKLELAPPSWYHMAGFIQDSLEADYGYGNDWYFYSIEKELFLIVADYIIHVKGFDKEKIYGLVYNRKVSEIEIKKSYYSQQYDRKLLIGNWVEDKENKDIKRKKLKVTGKEIIVNSQTYSDTLEWNLNKYGNKILIEKGDFERHGKYWKIQLLSNNELVIKRKIKENRESKIEILTLKKE